MRMFWFALVISLGILNPGLLYAQQAPKLKVIATTSIIGDWVKNVAGDLVEVTTLVGPDGDAHTFEPATTDIVALAHAQVIFENGFGLEHWMDKLYEASGSKAKRISLAKSVVQQPLILVNNQGPYREDVDSHVWHNVRYAVGMVKLIASTLQKLDLVNAKAYELNADAYVQQLQELDRWVTSRVAAVPRERRKIVTNHDSLGYFCERYQFQLIGAVFDSVSTEAEDSSARKMANLISQMINNGVKVVFAENIHNSKLIASLAQEAHVRLAPELYTDALSPKGGKAESYIKLIQYNTQTIVSALIGDGA